MMFSALFASFCRFRLAAPLLVLLFLPLGSTVLAQSSAAAPLPSPPLLSANSYLLIDHISGRVLAAKEPDKQIEPASLTKLMTAYIVSEELARGSITLDEPVIVSAEAQAMPGSRMFIEAGTLVTVEDLLRGLIIQSGNDASVALAEHVAASERGFVDMMNRTAASLGMKSTNFINASGLPDPEHYTTANDLAIIARAIINKHPSTYAMYSEREFTYNDITQRNRNTLLWRDDTVDGMKTGHTQAAGYCLLASAVRDHMRLISVVLGTGSDKARIAESQKLLNYGYRFFSTRQVYNAGETISAARVWMGQRDTLALGVADDLYLTLPRDAFDALQSRVEMNENIRAPIRIGQELGRSVLMVGDEVVSEVPLLALQKIEEGGMFTRMKHTIERLFH